jgi:hypothetical protein
MKNIQKAQVEYEILTRVQKLVESNYVDGRPKHHLASARNPEMEPNSSIFFITEFADITQMPTQMIQDIFRKRSIVIRDGPQRRFRWSPETLSLIGGLYQSRDIQGL